MIAALLAASLFLGSPAHIPDPEPVTHSVREVVHVASLMDILRSVGFTGNGLRMAYAIAMAESSGNAGAYNGNAGTGDKSYGLFQINMLGAMGPERRKQYGLSSNDDLYDPYVNAKVAFKMSNGGKNWGPWSTYNRGDYKKYLDGADISVSTSSGGGSSGGGGTVPALDSKELAEQYGFAYNFLNSIPELKKLFEQAVSGGWSKDMFSAKLRDTDWFKSTPADQRKWLLEMASDPATANQKWDQMNIKSRQIAAKLGIIENEFTWDKIHEATNGMLYKGWDEGYARFFLGQYIDLTSTGQQQGEAGQYWDQLHQYAYSMGVQQSDDWYQDRARLVARGIATVQDYKSEINLLAKAQFPQWTKQIEGGQTVADIAQPYLQSMATILELPAGSVNLFDNTIKSTLGWTDPKTLEKGAKPLWQFENELRSDPRWKQTKNAQDSLMQVGHKVLADFGLSY